MKIVVETCGFLPCHLGVFEIDGLKASQDDFVSMVSDGCPEAGGEEDFGDCPYDCHNMHAEALPLKEVREQLKESPLKDLTDEQISEIQERLVEALNVGDCGQCV